MESDAVNLETKWVYLDFLIPNTPIKTKVGIQAVKDQLKGIFLDADLAAIMTSSKVGSPPSMSAMPAPMTSPTSPPALTECPRTGRPAYRHP